MSTLGKYRLVRKLATGGMAQVYLAKAAGAMGFEKNVVLKRILPHLAEIPSFVEMFLAEAKLAARLDHPNIVQIFDFGEASGNFFLAMEYLDGPNLRALVNAARKQGRQLPLPACAKIISFACEGLAYAHELKSSETGEYLNLIHRDISPDNIMLSRNGAVKIVDFGIAKAADSTHQTRTGMLKGKLAYMPPEQLRAESLDRRADIFALGMVLYGLIAGNRPFEATSEVGMMQAILNEPLIPIANRRADVPTSLQAILDKALAKSREDRYPDCRAFQADLERFVLEMGEPVGAWQLARLVEELVPPAPIETTPVPTPSPASQETELGAVEVDLDTRMAPTPPLPLTEPGSPPIAREAPSTKPPPSSMEPAAPPAKLPQKRKKSRSSALGLLGAILVAGIASAWIVVPRIGHQEQDQTDMGARAATDSESVDEVASAVDTKSETDSPGVETATEEPGPDPVAQTQPEDAAEPESQPEVEEPEPPRTVVARPAQRRPAAQVPRKGVTSAGAATRATAAPTTQRASLTIDSNAPVQVRIGGRILGRTPVRVEDIAPGEVEVELFDRSLGISKRQRITVREGEQVSRTIEIGTGTLEFRVRPYANVFLNGRPLGQTPLAPVEVYEGRHVITLVNRELDREVRVEHQVQPGVNVFRYNLAE